jgi:hypothetical protein
MFKTVAGNLSDGKPGQKSDRCSLAVSPTPVRNVTVHYCVGPPKDSLSLTIPNRDRRSVVNSVR